MMGLGLALARPDKRVLVVTGDGELLMNLGSLASIAVLNPHNLSILCVDNGHYGETGYQRSHTSLGVDLEKIAAGSGIRRSLTVEREAEIAEGARLIREGNGTAFVLLRVKPTEPPSYKRNLDPAAGLVDAYPQEMTRVFLNLISNGFYAAAKRKEEEDGSFEPSLSATTRGFGSRVEVRIRDNGTGIPDEVKERMFNPFFTTKPAGEGTGLGLSMSHDIVVKQHGGRIEVVTEPGNFTEFIITLPRRAAALADLGGKN